MIRYDNQMTYITDNHWQHYTIETLDIRETLHNRKTLDIIYTIYHILSRKRDKTTANYPCISVTLISYHHCILHILHPSITKRNLTPPFTRTYGKPIGRKIYYMGLGLGGLGRLLKTQRDDRTKFPQTW